MDLKEGVLSDEENRESILSTSQYSDDDSILPFSTDSEEEKLPLSKFTCVKRKYSGSNSESKELMIERSLQSRKIVKIGDAWFSHPMYDDRSSPEDSSSDNERSMNDEIISYEAWDKKRKILKFQLSSCNDKVMSSSSKDSEDNTTTTNENNVAKSIFTSQQSHCESTSNIVDLILETSEESEQFDELYQEKEATLDIVKKSDEESDQIDELHQEIEDNNSNQFKKDHLNDRDGFLI
ncbi:hypothetical protein RclHR1_21440002 [Rhizophagus clarus]|uniref:Uncharacterized protein n=1 Tax=Rhizophagus clarus TaxID=94130 RepID=A0A2Z6R8J0_9GLOM|nr:hypothetical protein RclHR1_21440002 [Rhizophagus clarus]GES94933.1 hypothetical protein GLOIN_2v1761842 [Rhizophagus clarus]